jgi:hypothetical protein
MAQLTNIRTVSVPSIGKLPLADKPGTFTPSGQKREHRGGRLAEDGGFTEMATPARLDLNLNMAPGLDLAKLNAISSEDVTVRLSDGSVHLMPGAFAQEPVAVSDDTGKLVLISNTSEKV